MTTQGSIIDRLQNDGFAVKYCTNVLNGDRTGKPLRLPSIVLEKLYNQAGSTLPGDFSSAGRVTEIDRDELETVIFIASPQPL